MSFLDSMFDVDHKSPFHNRDDCFECHKPNLGFMVVFPLLVIVVFVLYGYHMAYQDTPPKRVFINDIDSSSSSLGVAKAKPLSQKSGVKKSHPLARQKAAKSHHQEARHTK
ncbi:MAG: hypothetical protein SGJ27_24650 [Candidatus Melainabacteria bacterium]|nr:hypothetical protein [Candidatus Melainabacteria bacterium]